MVETDCCCRRTAYIGNMLSAIVSIFENWIKPFAPRERLQPPKSLWGFAWFYARQAKGPFLAMAILGALSPCWRRGSSTSSDGWSICSTL